MTENQLFSMSTELFDTSSNSSNPLKYDLYSLGLTTTVGTTALFATLATNNSSNSHINSSANNPNHDHSILINSNFGASSPVTSAGNVSSNVMLTNAISIPRSNNPNQSHNPYQDELLQQHHPSASPFLSHILQHQQVNLLTTSPQQSQHQQQHQQQQQPQNQINQTTNSMMSSQQQSQQQQQQQQQQTAQNNQTAGGLLTASMAHYSDYALDALDASSLSPTLLQDVSLSAATQSLTPGHNSTTTSVPSPFYNHDVSSPLSINGGANGGINISSVNTTDITGVVTFLGSVVTAEEVSSSLLYDSNIAPTAHNAMWSDIGSAIVTTKTEPFNFEDDYIFPIDKTDLNAAGFGDLEGDNFLEDIGNLEEFLPSGANHVDSNGYLLSPNLNSTSNGAATTPSPGMGPPMELLQQQQQQQQQHQMQQFTQLQTMHQQQHAANSSVDSGNGSSTGSNSLLQQQQQQQHQQQQQQQQHQTSQQQQNHQSSSSSPFEIYHSTPNKHQLNSATFSPGSQSSHSPLQMNSITPPPPHANRSQFQQSQIKSRNIHELLKKDISMSPDRNNTSIGLLGHSVPTTHGLLMTQTALSPSSGSSGFGSTNGNSNNGSGAAVISMNSARKQFYHSMAANDGNALSRLSSSAPTHLGLEHIWTRREPRQHLLSTGSLAEAESFSSLSTASVLSPDGHDFSQDDDDNSTDYNSDNYDDFSSDNGSDNEDDNSTIRGRSNSNSSQQMSSSKGKERFFWQYNVQAKGPKGKRLVFQSKLEDPHFLNEVSDPVFSPNCSVRGIKVYKHSGKARKGDGNDLTPNPRKLNTIGKELDRLSRTINDMTPVSELPFNVRPKSRKEKNKLASRACRLKKKAQHEANKIKLYGLEIEHKRLLNAISDIKQNLILKYRKQNGGENVDETDQQIERIYKHAIGGLAIAGGTTDFVNKVLENVKNGQPSGGLEELRNT